ncbi:MAG: TetR/AcrR family transcriptional regulator [bacterium]|nr:TetR/AcrR family transcriptional regulator [bacterium]
MKSNNIKEPQQKRSIEKKEKIISAAMDLFFTDGYHKTNTADIAKAAGVSTGIVYRYFPDKKGILMEGLPIVTEAIQHMIFDAFKEKMTPDSTLSDFIHFAVDELLDYHQNSYTAHEQFELILYAVPEAMDYLYDLEKEITMKVASLLPSFGITLDHPFERVHLVYHMIEDLCHEITFHKHKEINPEVLKELVIEQLISLLQTSSSTEQSVCSTHSRA